MKIKASIIGASGYVGAELMRILTTHPNVEIKYLTSETSAGESVSKIYPHLRKLYEQKLVSMENLDVIAAESDVVFIGLPHGHAMAVHAKIKNTAAKIIDLGADYRLDPAVYETWYKVPHTDKETKAVYGLCELFREQIKGQKLVANPGCYTTASILALTPLVKEKLVEPDTIIVDAASGVTGAGRGLKLSNHFSEVFGNFSAYAVASHRHTPEIEEKLSQFAGEKITINFTPHLLPADRGILATCYARLKAGVGEEQVAAAFEKHYKDEFFIRLVGKESPFIKNVRASNFVDIGFVVDKRTGRVIVMSAIDNLVKGASGQAVQNMNILFGLDETTGLSAAPVYP